MERSGPPVGSAETENTVPQYFTNRMRMATVRDMPHARPLTPALGRAVLALVQGRKTPLLIVIPVRHLRVIDQNGDERSDQLTQILAGTGWTRLGEDLRPHGWCLVAEGGELGITDGHEYIAVQAVDGTWLTHVVSAGGLDVVYNPLGTPDIDDRLHLSSPFALCARLPLTIRIAA